MAGRSEGVRRAANGARRNSFPPPGYDPFQPVNSKPRRTMRAFVLGAALLLVATPLAAQRGSFTSGVSLHGNLHFNRSEIHAVEDVRQPEHGYGLGLEFAGSRAAVGLYGFAQGRARAFDSQSTQVHLTLEGNYYLPLESLRLAPFAGVHTGLGTLGRDYFDDPFLPRPRDGLGDLGYQFGVRFQPFSVVGVEAQWRQHAGSIQDELAPESEHRQVIVGVVIG